MASSLQAWLGPLLRFRLLSNPRLSRDMRTEAGRARKHPARTRRDLCQSAHCRWASYLERRSTCARLHESFIRAIARRRNRDGRCVGSVHNFLPSASSRVSQESLPEALRPSWLKLMSSLWAPAGKRNSATGPAKLPSILSGSDPVKPGCGGDNRASQWRPDWCDCPVIAKAKRERPNRGSGAQHVLRKLGSPH
jgi:hypothetical protein